MPSAKLRAQILYGATSSTKNVSSICEANMVDVPYKGLLYGGLLLQLLTQRTLKSILQRRRGTTKWWLRRARRATLLAVAFERKLVLPLLCPIHTAPTTLLIRLLLASHPPSPLGKAMVSLWYETIFLEILRYAAPRRTSPPIVSSSSEAKDLDGKYIHILGVSAREWHEKNRDAKTVQSRCKRRIIRR